MSRKVEDCPKSYGRTQESSEEGPTLSLGSGLVGGMGEDHWVAEKSSGLFVAVI